MLDQFQILDQSHLKMSTTLINPKESGWKHDSLPWFWYMDVEGDSLSSNYMKEYIYVVHWVNWLRAKAAFERATEENTLVQYEMKWTTAYFNYWAAEWRKRKEADYSHGHKIYAAQQETMWEDFADAARKSFIQLGVIID
ncbi:hypothetical protein L208DRAFT_1311844 [Tricholoma matsutake]|nr:hypothetical protein L208DRAFT_1311844 [Tricholoma matsutake 945]